MTITAALSPVVKYHGLARRYLLPPRFLMRPLLNGGTLGGPQDKMSSNLASYLVIAAAVLAGVVWGRLSSRLPIPEWLRLLSIFLWTGLLGLGAMLIGCVVKHSWSAPAVVEAAALGPFALLRLAVGETGIWFLLGAVFGLPASLGWVIGYRQPSGGR